MTLTRRELVRGLCGLAGASVLPARAVAVHESVALASAESRSRVVVVGAGLAGLAAAYELDRSGVDVRLLEASHLPGGRVRTLRNRFADGLIAEAGAQTAGGSYSTFMSYAKEFGIGLSPNAPEAGVTRTEKDVLLHLGGEVLRLSDLRRDPALWPLELSERERSLAPFGLLPFFVAPLAREVGNPGQVLEAAFAKYDSMSLHDLLVERGASPAAIEMIQRPLNYNSTRTVSALSVLRDGARRLESEAAFEIQGGNDLLPRAFARRLGRRIEYGAALRRIERREKRLELSVERHGLVERLVADRLIVTLPFTALRRIEVDPPFSEAKSEIIRVLPYTQVAKTHVQTRSRFWTAKRDISAVWSDGPCERVFDVSGSVASGRGLLLVWINGDGLEPFSRRDPSDHDDKVVSFLRQVLPEGGPEIEHAITSNWFREYSRGAYAHYAPGQLQKFAAEIPRPEGPVHFAGEHTQLVEPGMEGALVSGVRTAREVLEALADTSAS